MSLPTVIAAIAVAILISAIAATAGYYLQVRMRRLEQLEKKLLHNLIDSLSLKSRRLYELRKKQAMMGLNTPPEVLIEIEELEEEIHELEEEFQIAGERIEALKEVTADAKAVP